MRGKWIGWFGALAALAFIVTLMPWFAAPHEPRTTPGGTRAASADKEHTLKMKTVNRDMEATAQLCRTQCSRHLYKLMMAESDEPSKLKQVDHLLRDHKQIAYVLWQHGGRMTAKGHKPADSGNRLAAQLSGAKASLREGKSYISPSLQLDGRRYEVLGVPDTKRKGDGMIGIIRQDIVAEVERHQKRNMRLVPYPAEGHYKVESVAPNSTRDITVRSGEDNGNASHYHVNEVVVKFRQQPTTADLNRIKSDIAAISARKLGYTYVFRSVRMDARAMIAYFQTNWQTEYVEPHYLYMTNEADTGGVAPIIPNDELYSQYQWNLPTIDTEKGWTISKGSDNVLIAVLDTGVQTDHPDLQGKLEDGVNLVSEDEAPEDDVGHGTHVAGIIAAAVNNGEGVAGLSWYNKILPVKVLDDSGAGSTYTVAQGIIWATDNGAKVINMSLGNYAEAEFLHDAVKYAYDHDVVLIAASGNDNTDRPGYPAAYPEVFAVASTESDGSRSTFSNYGDYIDVAAPGGSIASTYPGSQYAALSGTSMASPHVAALAGLIRSINPDLTNVEVMDMMRNSAIDLGDEGKDSYFGYGQIDIVQALEMARQSRLSLQQFPSQVERRLERLADQFDIRTPASD